MQFITDSNRKWWIFIAVGFSIIMVDLDITAVNLALAVIAHDINIDLSTAQWIIDGYMIAAAALMALGGRLSDMLGWKRIFLFGLLIFTFASLAVGLSTGAWSILLSRIIQGACIAFTFPVGLVLIRLAFPPEQQGFAMGLAIAIAGLSQALGPTVGGIIVHLLSWRWIFFVDIPIAMFALIVAYYSIPKDTVKTTTQSFHLGGASTLILGLFAIMTALNEVTHWSMTSTKFIGLIALGIISLATFVFIEFHSKNPLLELRLLINKNFSIVNTIRIFFNFIYFTMLFVLGLMLQNILGYSPLHAGYILLFLTLVFGVLSIPSGKLIDKIGPKNPTLIGFFLLAISNLLLAIIPNVTLPVLITALIIAGFAIALLVPATGTAALISVEIEKSGAAAGVFFTNAFIGGGIGVAISGWLLSTQSHHKLYTSLDQLSIKLTSTQLAELKHAATGIHTVAYRADLFSPVMINKLSPIVNEAFISGFATTMWLCVILGVLSILFTTRLHLPHYNKIPTNH